MKYVLKMYDDMIKNIEINYVTENLQCTVLCSVYCISYIAYHIAYMLDLPRRSLQNIIKNIKLYEEE